MSGDNVGKLGFVLIFDFVKQFKCFCSGFFCGGVGGQADDSEGRKLVYFVQPAEVG